MAKSGRDGHDGQQHMFFLYTLMKSEKFKNPKKSIKYPKNPKNFIKSQQSKKNFKISLEIVFVCVANGGHNGHDGLNDSVFLYDFFCVQMWS